MSKSLVIAEKPSVAKEIAVANATILPIKRKWQQKIRKRLNRTVLLPR